MTQDFKWLRDQSRYDEVINWLGGRWQIDQLEAWSSGRFTLDDLKTWTKGKYTLDEIVKWTYHESDETADFASGVIVPIPTLPWTSTITSLACCTAEGAPVPGLSFAPSI